jgi:hypothetical protein
LTSWYCGRCCDLRLLLRKAIMVMVAASRCCIWC